MHLKKPKKKGGGGKKKPVKGGGAIPSGHVLDDQDEELVDDGEETQASLGSSIRADYILTFDCRLDLQWRHDSSRNPSTTTRSIPKTQT